MPPPCAPSLGGSSPLIVDVGFNIGQDTSLFLEAGYRVVAVEANPHLCEWATKTSPFKEAIASGRLTLLNRAIVGAHNVSQPKLPFYLSRHTERNRLFTCYEEPCKIREVQTITCAKLLRQHGDVHYLKCDVEGADDQCMASIASEAADGRLKCLPRYMSVEDNIASHARETFDSLVRLGYTSWKYAEQESWSPNGHLQHGGATGAFGEFAFDRGLTRYAWRTVAQTIPVKGKRRPKGDMHMKLNTSWEHPVAQHDYIQSASTRPASWPLA